MKGAVVILLIAIIGMVLYYGASKPEHAAIEGGVGIINAQLDAVDKWSRNMQNGYDVPMDMSNVNAAKAEARQKVDQAGKEGVNIMMTPLWILLGMAIIGFGIYVLRTRR